VPRSLESSQTRNAVELADPVCPRSMTTSSPVGCEVEDRPGNLVRGEGAEPSIAANASSAPPCPVTRVAVTRPMPEPAPSRKPPRPGHVPGSSPFLNSWAWLPNRPDMQAPSVRALNQSQPGRRRSDPDAASSCWTRACPSGTFGRAVCGRGVDHDRAGVVGGGGPLPPAAVHV